MSVPEDQPDPYIVTREYISVAKALEIRDVALDVSDIYKLPGGVVVASLMGEICSQLTGDEADPGTLIVARGKVQTVLNSRRSSSLQNQRMRRLGYDRADYMGRMGSLFGGGVAIFLDEARQRFIGAVAFSGGSWEEDEELAARAVVRNDLYTDIDPITRNILAKRQQSS